MSRFLLFLLWNKNIKMKFYKKFSLLINLFIFLFFNFYIINEVNSQTEKFANSPQIDFAFTKTQYVKDRFKSGTYILKVRMKEGMPQFQVVEEVYSSLDFLDEFHLNFVAEHRKSNIRTIKVDLEVDSSVTIEVLNMIELKLQYLNQLRVNYLNSEGDKLYHFIPPNSFNLGCFGWCCPTDKGFHLEQKVEFEKDVYEIVSSNYSTESECFENAVRKEGLFISIVRNKIFIEDKEVSLFQMGEILYFKWDKLKIKSRFVIVLKLDRNSTYEFYLKTISELYKLYFDIRNNISLERHRLPFNKSSRKEQKKIKNEVPIIIKKIYD